jgi:hypothetical protein
LKTPRTGEKLRPVQSGVVGVTAAEERDTGGAGVSVIVNMNVSPSVPTTQEWTPVETTIGCLLFGPQCKPTVRDVLIVQREKKNFQTFINLLDIKHRESILPGRLPLHQCKPTEDVPFVSSMSVRVFAWPLHSENSIIDVPEELFLSFRMVFLR